ncbi:hypothetical protein [Cochleicola gelatinilyticus]|uniref:STAS/SEC14 domain-containing protein n=1 Tax=Cochleicola gelatinilyticus TaxID=1763537 RepID=A0A167HPY6_9FLAO|nr:hypothetical protein [Cochleicola gelatinilyticus]OAB78841.1 hypothetical protein ULVI_09680 [Cochleicola gelatinilyticus]
MSKKFPKIIKSELATVTICKNIVVFEANPDVLVTIKSSISLLTRSLIEVGSRPMVYISHRINNYAVNPIDYKYLERLPNLKGIAVVGYTKMAQESVKLEENFFKKPILSFSTFDEAKIWADQLISKSTTVLH